MHCFQPSIFEYLINIQSYFFLLYVSICTWNVLNYKNTAKCMEYSSPHCSNDLSHMEYRTAVFSMMKWIRRLSKVLQWAVTRPVTVSLRVGSKFSAAFCQNHSTPSTIHCDLCSATVPSYSSVTLYHLFLSPPDFCFNFNLLWCFYRVHQMSISWRMNW